MTTSNDCNPMSINECNMATSALMLEITDRMKFDSIILTRGQEDFLTINEYEALFEADMKICEDALDVVLCLAKKQKAYLEAMIAAKRLERSIPKTITETLTQLSVQKSDAFDKRRRVECGDLSFFVSATAQENSVNHILENVESVNVPGSKIPVVEDDCAKENLIESQSIAPTDYSVPSSSSYRIRERPQFCSDAARRLLQELESMQVDKRTLMEGLRVETQFLSSKDCSTNPQHVEKPVCLHITTSGGSNLDGSLILDGEAESVQNGIRAYSPVIGVPPQPNFDETGMESLCEPFLVPPGIIRPEPLRPGEGSKVPFESTRNPLTEKAGNNAELGSTSEPSWISAYKPRPRPKFTSSVGRLLNQE